MKKKVLTVYIFVTLLFLGITVKAYIENPTINKLKFSNINYSKAINKTDNPTLIILGKWEGIMGGKKLTIVIDKVNGKEISGYNILGTNKRLLKGTFKKGEWAQACSVAFDALLNEPGDDKWDGVFDIKFVGYQNEEETNYGLICSGKYSGTEGSGLWKSNNGKMQNEFNLKKIK